ncbi:MAG: protease HtpX [Rhodanobacter sp.]|jgi:heat shock protein HtpX|nr:protease HtpX [Rhodanobacter sp.]
MMRVLLFVATNIAVLVLLNIVLFIVQGVFHVRLGGYSGLLVIAAVMGMGGSFISLAMSKWIALRTTGAQVIQQPHNEAERWLLDTVRSEAQKAGIGMPDVAIYDAPDMNAFATGMRRDHALVAVSTGLLHSMNRDQVQAVLGHEITHVANGDMVTMGLIQGVLNTFVIFFARVIGSIIDNALSGNRREGEGGGVFYFIIVMVLQTILGIFASMIVMWFSRWREFRADAGGARLGGRDNMVSALQCLAGNQGETTLPKAIQAFGISGAGGISRLFMSHPPIEERIAALRTMSS